MHQKCAILFLSIFLSIQLFAQGRGEAILYDSLKRQPIPFATVKVLHKPVSTFCDSTGRFMIRASVTDSLEFTSIGYQSAVALKGYSDTFYLKPAVKMMPLVTLRSGKPYATCYYGIRSEPDYKWRLLDKEEFAQKVDLELGDTEYARIKYVEVSVRDLENTTPVLLHIYAMDTSTGMPGRELLSFNHLLSQGLQRHKKLFIDLTTENLVTDEKTIFVSVQHVGPSEGEENVYLLNMTNSSPYARTYYRRSDDENRWSPAAKIDGKASNIIIEVVVDKFKYRN